MADVMRRLVKDRLPLIFVRAAQAPDPQVAHAAAKRGPLPGSLADTGLPADFLRLPARQRVTERTAFRFVREQGNRHPKIMPGAFSFSHTKWPPSLAAKGPAWVRGRETATGNTASREMRLMSWSCDFGRHAIGYAGQ